MWTVEQTANYLGLSKGHVRALITQRKLPAIRVGTIYRIHPDDAQALVRPVGVR
jgi:excisionase family DNA binding protein